MSRWPELPASVVNPWTVPVGLVPLAAAIGWLLAHPEIDGTPGMLLLMLAYGGSVALFDLTVARVHRRDSTGLDWSAPRRADHCRVAIKLVGLFGVLVALIGLHGLFRFYPLQSLAAPLTAIVLLLPFGLPLIALYFAFIDRRMRRPQDGYWVLGQAILHPTQPVNWPMLREFLMGWTIKGFFLPIMFYYGAETLDRLQQSALFDTTISAILTITALVVLAELVIVCVGYAMTARVFDAHIRSPNPFVLGWLVTLICYEPFSAVVFDQVFNRHTGRSWADVIANYPWLFWPWIVGILITFATWLWATAIFGLRWSNLTNRGIITNGPFRFTKHPDYVSKVVFFWLTAAPFLTAFSTWQAITATAALVAITGIYFGRARMEERHLSEAPAYVAYALAMNQRSIFRPVAGVLPFLVYRCPDGRTGLDMPDAAEPADRQAT